MNTPREKNAIIMNDDGRAGEYSEIIPLGPWV